jgi:vacuolar iron transporter family protein
VVTNARELASTPIAKEAAEIEQTPQAEQHELALIYQAKGLPKEDAQRIAAELMSNKQAALDTLAREELGIDHCFPPGQSFRSFHSFGCTAPPRLS